MIDTTRRPARRTTSADRAAARRRRAASISDGVIAAYVHELSVAARPSSGNGPAYRAACASSE
jgi:hypothetical protein